MRLQDRTKDGVGVCADAPSGRLVLHVRSSRVRFQGGRYAAPKNAQRGIDRKADKSTKAINRTWSLRRTAVVFNGEGYNAMESTSSPSTGNWRGHPEANNNEPEHIMTHQQRQLHAKIPATEHPWTRQCARTIRTATEIAQYEAAVDIANAPGILTRPPPAQPVSGRGRTTNTFQHHRPPLPWRTWSESRSKIPRNQRATALRWSPGGSQNKDAGRDKAGTPRRPTEEKPTETHPLPNQRKPSDALC